MDCECTECLRALIYVEYIPRWKFEFNLDIVEFPSRICTFPDYFSSYCNTVHSIWTDTLPHAVSVCEERFCICHSKDLSMMKTFSFFRKLLKIIMATVKTGHMVARTLTDRRGLSDVTTCGSLIKAHLPWHHGSQFVWRHLRCTGAFHSASLVRPHVGQGKPVAFGQPFVLNSFGIHNINLKTST